MDFETNQGIMSPKADWPGMTKKERQTPAIDLLKPGSDTHARVLEYLMARYKASASKMSQFYARWRVAERKLQAYIKHEDYERLLKELNEDSWSPKPVDLIVPYSYSVMQTRATYLMQTFAGRKPIFQVSSTSKNGVDSARAMEAKLQYDCDHTRMLSVLWQFFLDNNAYGVGVLRTNWLKTQGMRTVFTDGQRGREAKVTYEGNEVENIDPFMFFPDPRVPMHQVARKGEYCFAKTYEGRHTLKTLEADGIIKWVDQAHRGKRADEWSKQGSNRNLLTGGDAHAGYGDDKYDGTQDFYEALQGTCVIVPAELGLGEGTRPEKWLFTILGANQIVQAQPFEADHDMHPFAVSEPDGLGYSFGSIGQLDMLAPMQDTMSWFLNSHVQNVRAALNNMLVVDPSRFEMQDITKPGPGRVIRAKKSAYGSDLKASLFQLPIQDITRSHTNDFQMFKNMADSVGAVTDNLRGLQADGGRKTATEVRTAADAGTSRLSATARVISAHAFSDLTEQMSLNNQQYLSNEFEMELFGSDGSSIRISPQHIVGDFVYPIHDGALPMDKLAMVDIWREIVMGVGQSPILSQRFDMVEMFAYLAELAGARNVDRFRLQSAPDQQVDAMVAAGDAVPASELGNISGVEQSPANRLTGGM